MLIAKGLERAVAAKLARKIFGRYLVKRLPRIVPVVGTIAGASIHYASMRTVGKAAVAYYSGSEPDEE